MVKINYILSFILLGFITACSITKSPKKPFEAYQPSSPPDYSKESAWSALPQKEDYADHVPLPLQNEETTQPAADVFFIHPTTFMGGLAWNADINDTELNAKTDERAIKHQASIFNQSGRVYAPRYRQMSFGGFFTEDTTSEKKALMLAYRDVKTAFQYYLRNYNENRPIIIASHSQGTVHAIRLIQEFFDGTELQPQLVAAYLPGWPVTPATFSSIPACLSPDQTGCVTSWNSWKMGSLPKNYDSFYKGAIVTNPITWKTDDSLAPKSKHKGFVTSKYDKVIPQKLEAQGNNGILLVSKPFRFTPTSNLHVGDFNLFWVDVRENVALRIKHYLQDAKTKANRSR
jgi:hypothetical protein